MSSEKSDIILLSDETLRQTYTYNHGVIYKTNLLGLEPECEKQFKTVFVNGSIFAQGRPNITDIQQGKLGNCAFLSALRGIFRRYPQAIPLIIREIDNRYVEIKLFSDVGQPIVYKLEKTIVAENTSLVSSIYNFFASSNYEKPWVKLIEKALALHAMRSPYNHDLMRLQTQGRLSVKYVQGGASFSYGKKVIPSYEDVIDSIGNDNPYLPLIGCKSKKLFGRDNHYKADEGLKTELINGELISVSFLENKFGLEELHIYELVNFVSIATKEYAVMSNPWGFNDKKSDHDFSKLDLSSMKTLLADTFDLQKDKDLIFVPIPEFFSIINKCNVTIGASKSWQQKQDISAPAI